ncbi:MAG: glycosyltransferase [Fibrobacter sp.]|nr:glycosyltransferase [Fibrobacter sp.]
MPQEQPLISVIVPVYKVEAYLDPCVESIVNQTYRNLEIILVDDGSPDRCPEMCDAWAAKDSRIKVVHKKNGGASDARNAGLDVFLGDYVTFIDADDLVASDMVEVLFKGCVDNGADVSMCALQNFSENAPCLDGRNSSAEKILSGEFVCTQFFCCYGPNPVSKLFKRSVVKESRFILDRKMGEDAAFTYPILYAQERICFVQRYMYFYRSNPSSVTGKYSLKQLDELDTLQEMLAFYKEKKEGKIYNAMALEYFARILAHESKMKKFGVEDASAQERLREEKSALIRKDGLTLANKLLFCFGKNFPGMFRKLFFQNQARRKRMYGGC